MSKKILIVDDEPDVLIYLSEILKDNNYQPFSANNAELGLEVLKKIKPDIVCLDIMMPKESGISMYIKIKKSHVFKHVPILIISGIVQEEKFDFRAYVPDKSIPPPDYYFEKPLDVGKFVEAVNKLTFRKSVANDENKQDA